MTIQLLLSNEIDQVHGAGILGNSIQFGANVVSSAFNAITPVGWSISLIPLAGIAHYQVDLALNQGINLAYKAGAALGGELNQVEFHLEDEKANGSYSPLGFIRFFV